MQQLDLPVASVTTHPLPTAECCFAGVGNRLLALLCTFVCLFSFSSSSAQCLPQWRYQAPITVNNTANPAALSGFQVKVVLNTAAPIAAGKMQASGSDIRFVDGTCTPLSYWIEGGLNTAATVIWVKVPAIAGSSSTQLTLYYGNATAPATSNGDATFELFDGFDGNSLNTAKWSVYGTAPVVAGGTINFTSTTSSIIRSVAAYAAPVVAEANVTAASGNWPNIAQLASGTFNGYSLTLDGAYNIMRSNAMFLWRTYANGSSYAAGAAPDYSYTNTIGNLIGIWSLSWVNNQQKATWPGGTLNLTGSSNAYPNAVQLAVGGVETGSGSMTVDWYRARKYTPTEPSTLVGAEQATISLSTLPLAATAFCPGGSIAVPYTATGAYAAGNVFTAQLSSATGDFTAPVAIGSLAATASGSISATLPAGTAAGTGYRIRVVSSMPALTAADNGTNLTVNSPAVVAVPANIMAVNDANQCGASIAFAATATGTPAPAITYAVGGTPITSPYLFPIGTTTVTATATNSCNADSKTFTVTVQDKQAPTVLTQNISVALANGTATITAAQVDGGSNDNCTGPLSYSLDKTTFSCANIGSNTVTLTVTDASGNQASGSATVTITGSIPAPTISVVPANGTYTGGVPTTLYLGYGPQSATLVASGAGQGGTYQWSPSAGLSATTGASPVFTASAAGTFAYTVTATSASGCSATTSVTLTVVDARCSSNGKKLDKVLVCHNGNTLCIGSDGVADHLAHGDQLGNCPANAAAQATGLARTPATTTDGEVSTSFEAYPNPFSSSTTLRFRAAQAGAAQVQVYNGLGELVATLYSGQLQAGELVERTLSGTGLSAGLYTCRYVAPGGERLTQRVVLTK
jgi:hypothetical protein